jgi:hypothetical protein
MSDSISLLKPADAEPPKRKLYVKPSIEKINLVPQESVLSSFCATETTDPECYEGTSHLYL